MSWTNGFLNLFGNTYTSFYWCLFPATPQEEAVPRLQDCQDSLQDRFEKLKTRDSELRDELFQLRNRRDRSRLRRVWMERQSIVRDIKITENTLWTIERQIALFERSDLDALIICSLRASNQALQEMAEKGGYSVSNVEDITESLQQRMQEANDITENVSGVLQTGLEQDMDGLERELECFLNGDDSMLDFVITVPATTAMRTEQDPSASPSMTATGHCVQEMATGSIPRQGSIEEVGEEEAQASLATVDETAISEMSLFLELESFYAKLEEWQQSKETTKDDVIRQARTQSNMETNTIVFESDDIAAKEATKS